VITSLASLRLTSFGFTLPAAAADAEWNRVHSAGEVPVDLPEITINPDLASDGTVWICKLLVAAGMSKSNGEARRLIGQGGVVINGAKLENADAEIKLADLAGAILRVGPRRYAKLKID
jgi:tyrosyl-tRNA synthetase